MITYITTKPWGREIRWTMSERYVGKILRINAGHRLSRQYHQKKDETFLIQTGEMLLEIGDQEFLTEKRMRAGDRYHCRPGTIHRMIAISDCDVIEVSSPELNDVIRLSDDYGREGTNTP